MTSHIRMRFLEMTKRRKKDLFIDLLSYTTWSSSDLLLNSVSFNFCLQSKRCFPYIMHFVPRFFSRKGSIDSSFFDVLIWDLELATAFLDLARTEADIEIFSLYFPPQVYLYGGETLAEKRRQLTKQ